MDAIKWIYFEWFSFEIDYDMSSRHPYDRLEFSTTTKKNTQ